MLRKRPFRPSQLSLPLFDPPIVRFFRFFHGRDHIVESDRVLAYFQN